MPPRVPNLKKFATTHLAEEESSAPPFSPGEKVFALLLLVVMLLGTAIRYEATKHYAITAEESGQ